jgi:hypothetical protein
MTPEVPMPPQADGAILPWARQITAYVRSLLPKSGPGARVTRRSGGTTYSTTPAVRAREKFHPFEVFATSTTAADQTVSALKVRITPGTLMEHERATSGYTITGLDDEYTLSATHGLWLHVEWGSDGDMASAAVESGEITTDIQETWELLGTPPDDKSERWYQLIAYLRPSREGEGGWNFATAQTLVQVTTTNLMGDWKCSAGPTRELIRAIVPWHRAYEAS